MTLSKSAAPIIVAFVILVAVILPARLKGSEIAQKSSLVMGTVVEIKVSVAAGRDRESADAAIGKALEEVRRVEAALSVYRPDSEVSQINRLKEGEQLVLSAETFGLIAMAIELGTLTDGAFDITAKPLVDLWAAARASGRLPSDDDVRDALERVGSRDIILDAALRTISFGKAGMAIDLGAIAKGYATDRAVAVLKANGVRDAIVDSGGDMYCLGKRTSGERWKVGIRHPRAKDKIFMELKLEDMAVDTSGDYEKFFIVDGKRYSHIIDPRTGYPIGDDVISASVIAGDSVTADALATGACVLGRNAMNIFDASGIDAIIVYKENGSMRVAMSDGLKGRYDAVEVSAIK